MDAVNAPILRHTALTRAHARRALESLRSQSRFRFISSWQPGAKKGGTDKIRSLSSSLSSSLSALSFSPSANRTRAVVECVENDDDNDDNNNDNDDDVDNVDNEDNSALLGMGLVGASPDEEGEGEKIEEDEDEDEKKKCIIM